MEEWDDRALREINSLDAARLAIRGALATIRDLQDQNGNLKGQVQDDSAKRKALESRIGEMDNRLASWQEQAKKWEREAGEREQMMQRWKTEARMEVRAEERARVDADRIRTEEALARLRADLGAMASAHKGKQEAASELRRMLDARDADIMNLKREKQDILAKVKLEAQQLEMLREARDRELNANNHARELEIVDNDREIASLERELEEGKMALAAIAQDRELGVKAREEELVRVFSAKEADMITRYQKREAELQARWSELETGLWAKTKESRAKLDEAVQTQFEERARQIADRAKEVEDLLARRSLELNEAHEKRCASAEAHYAADERRLLASWAEKEQRLLAKVDAELVHERGVLQATWAERHKALEAEHAERLRQAAAKIAELEAEGRRDRSLLLEEGARNDAARVREQDDFVSRKEAELEKLHQEKLVVLAERGRALDSEAKRREEARQNEHLSRIAALETQHALRRGELLEEHRKTVEAERFSLSAQYDQRSRALDEAHLARTAEAERTGRALAEQYEFWKATLRNDFLLKEKELDARWLVRDGELVGRYEAALEDQRRAFTTEAVEGRKRLEAQRARLEAEALARHSREHSERQAAHEARLSELRLSHDEGLRLVREKSFEDLARERAGLQKDLTDLQERLARTQAEMERARITDASLAKDLNSRLAALEVDRAALSRSLVAVEREASNLRAAVAERDRMREIERARLAEEAKLLATAELARALEEAERDRARALSERRVELEKAHASRRRALEDALAERGRALDVKEERLEEEAVRLAESRAEAARHKKSP